MTVAELIEILQSIEDTSKQVFYFDPNTNDYGMDLQQVFVHVDEVHLL